MGQVSGISQIIAQAIERQGSNKSEIARKLGISSQLLGQYEKGPKEPKLAFYVKWWENFKEDLLGEIETKVYNISRNESGLQIKEIESSLASISTDIGRVLTQQTIARAEVRAFGQYQVSKDAMGDKDQILEIMGQIGKLIGANLKASEKEDKKTA